jgi:putative transposase
LLGHSVYYAYEHRIGLTRAGIGVIAFALTCRPMPPMKRVFRSLKSEWVSSLGYRSIPDARKDIGDYLMNYYNRQRPHTFNDGMPPVIAEEKLKILSGIS